MRIPPVIPLMACIIPKWSLSISNPASNSPRVHGRPQRRCSPLLPASAQTITALPSHTQLRITALMLIERRFCLRKYGPQPQYRPPYTLLVACESQWNGYGTPSITDPLLLGPLRDGIKITSRFAFTVGVPSSSTLAGGFQRRSACSA